jgi:S-adenosylmethionine decarboxylase
MIELAETLSPTALGRHLLLELYECDREFLDQKDSIRDALVSAAREAGATVVETVFHRFSPQGVSGVVVIAESHVTVHTWPEQGYAALDVFTCGKTEIIEKIKDRLVFSFSAKRSNAKLIHRGIEAPPAS